LNLNLILQYLYSLEKSKKCRNIRYVETLWIKRKCTICFYSWVSHEWRYL